MPILILNLFQFLLRQKNLIQLLPLIHTIFHHFYHALPTNSQKRDILPDYIVEENSEKVINYIPNNISQQKSIAKCDLRLFILL